MKVWLSGANGQLGWELSRLFGSVESCTLLALNRHDLDITDPEAVNLSLKEFVPDIVINAAAYTAVDKAEDEPEKAFAVNEKAPAVMAEYCQRTAIPMIHISTDYVFDGKQQKPYVETDPVNPLNIYGASKLAGELAIAVNLEQNIILRTSWVFGQHGNNFVKTMLRLFREKEEIKVVNDQFGCPTYAGDLAYAVKSVCEHIEKKQKLEWGVYHYCGTPKTSWMEFAKSILHACGGGATCAINPVSSAYYSSPATRPENSELDCSKFESVFGVAKASWEDKLGFVSEHGDDG